MNIPGIFISAGKLLIYLTIPQPFLVWVSLGMKRPCGEWSKNLQKDEQEFWECLKKEGDEVELKYARDLPDDTPDFILRMLAEFEDEVADFCFADAKGSVLDAGCGNANLLMRSMLPASARYIGMDFSKNMLSRAVPRARGIKKAHFIQSCINHLPLKDSCFDHVVSSGVITCLPSVNEASQALEEFHRILKPEGTLVVDFFNQLSHFTLVRRHIFKEAINPPEYIAPRAFREGLEEAGFEILEMRGFDFKPCQGYLFMSRLRPIIDPGFIQERFSRFLEAKVVPRVPEISLLGYRIYVKCIKSGH